MRIALSILAVFLSLAGGLKAYAQTNYSALFPSIVRVVGLTDDGVNLGSGVVISRDDQGSYIVTNFHVVANAQSNGLRIVAPKVIAQGGGGDSSDTVVVSAKYWGGDRLADVAILYAPNFFRDPLPLAVGDTPENLSIRALGYPGTDLEQWKVLKTTPTMTDGIVSTTQVAPWQEGSPAVKQVQHTAALNEGMSGGPLLDLCGRVVAINTAYNAVAHGSNLALAASDITPYLKKQNLAFTASRDPCDPNAATAAAAAQKTAAADAQRLNDAAKAKVEADQRQDRTRLIIIIAVGLIVLTGVAALILWTLRGPRATKGPAHGLVLKGVHEAARTSQIIRVEDLIGPSGVEVGRSPSFGSQGTSRRHARVLWTQGQGFMLRDLGSNNGTRINGKEIKGEGDQPIKLGDIVEFGDPEARYSVEKL
jgi:hypothetical protein